MIFGYPKWYRQLSPDRYAPGCTDADKAEADAFFLEMAEADRRARAEYRVLMAIVFTPMILMNLGLLLWARTGF